MNYSLKYKLLAVNYSRTIRFGRWDPHVSLLMQQVNQRGQHMEFASVLRRRLREHFRVVYGRVAVVIWTKNPRS